MTLPERDNAQRPAVFLDRDGVLNEAFVRSGIPVPPKHLEEFRLLPGVQVACQTLTEAGFALVVITNQPDIARGTQTRAMVDAMNGRLRELVPDIAEVVVCPHDDADGCVCRKPQPGMILDAARRLALDLTRSVAVGDRWRDIEAARRAGVHSVYIDCHYDERKPADPDIRASSLLDAVPFIKQLAQGSNALRRSTP